MPPRINTPRQLMIPLKCSKQTTIYHKKLLIKVPPKVYKENHPGRPVVSSINSHSTRISEYVDHHLQPYTEDIKSYKDTKDFLNHLHKVPTNISKNSYLVTLDVNSLYTYIPNEEGINISKMSSIKTKANLLKLLLRFYG